MELKVNGTSYTLDVPADERLLWVLRDRLGLTGTKFGCGVGICGACTVHVNGAAVRSCLMPVAAVAEADIGTIEGLAETDGDDAVKLHPVQQAFIDQQVPQCGWCMSGQIMQAAAFLAAESAANCGGDGARHERELLPLRLLCAYPAGSAAGRG